MPETEDLFNCWCGVSGKFEEMCQPLPRRCDGHGTLECECGGDHLCICHNHGEVDCPGCPDCKELEWDDDLSFYDLEDALEELLQDNDGK